MQSANKEWKYINNLEEVGFKRTTSGWQDPKRRTREHTIYKNAQGKLVQFHNKIKHAPDSVQAGTSDAVFLCPCCNGIMSFHGSEFKNAYVSHFSSYAIFTAWCPYLKRTKNGLKNLVKIRRGEIPSEYSRSLPHATKEELIFTVKSLVDVEMRKYYLGKQELIERKKELEKLLDIETKRRDRLEGDLEDLRDEYTQFIKAANLEIKILNRKITELENNNEAQIIIKRLESEIAQLIKRLAEVSYQDLLQKFNNLDREYKDKFVDELPKTFDTKTGAYIYD